MRGAWFGTGLGAVTLAAHTVVKNIVDYANNIFGTFNTVAQSLVASELGKVLCAACCFSRMRCVSMEFLHAIIARSCVAACWAMTDPTRVTPHMLCSLMSWKLLDPWLEQCNTSSSISDHNREHCTTQHHTAPYSY